MTPIAASHGYAERCRSSSSALPVPAPKTASPLVLQLHDLPFDELNRTRTYLERVLEYADASVHHFYDAGSGGFFHRVDPNKIRRAGDFSKASTATVVAFLKRSG